MPRVPDWMRDNFRRGLKYHEEGRSGDVVPTTVREARQAVEDGDLPMTKPKRMAAWFARHMTDLDGAPSPGDAGYPTRGQVAHMLWGGGASKPVSERAMRWAERVRDRIEETGEASVDAVTMNVEGGGVLPDGYRPATSEDVPEGRACGNCVFYDEDDTRVVDGGVEVRCTLWDAYVRGDHYCDRWEAVSMDGMDDDAMESDSGGLPEQVVMVVATEGELTADGRIADPGGLSWREPPLPLTVNHDDDQRVGRVDAFRRVASVDGLTVESWDSLEDDESGYIIAGLATLNLDTEIGRSVAGELRDGFLTGVSMEVGDEIIEMDDDGVMHLVEGRIGAVSVVVFQAIESARLVETASARWWQTPDDRLVAEALVASSVPTVPPADWFTDPMFDAAQPLTVMDDGQVFGHLALWDTCHTGKPVDVCLTPPRSASGYAYFLTGEVKCEDGTTVPVGSLTMATGHASTRPGVTASEAVAHYEHTGAAVADVTAGEDEFGIWVAGALRPGVTAEQVRELRGGSLSGDWRHVRGSLELVAALAVNVPGFPVPRVQTGIAASGVQTALVAASPVEDCGCGSVDSGLEARVRHLETLLDVVGLPGEALAKLAERVGLSD